MKKNRIFILMILLIISFSLFIISYYSIDPDYLWHIKAGEVFFNDGIITKDMFSWIVNGKYWMCHEWLFEIIIYIFKIIFGKLHIFIYCFVFISLLLLSLFIMNKDNYLKNIVFTLIWFLFSLILIPGVQVRPQLMSNILLLLTIYLCNDNYKSINSKKIYLLPFISILWSNIHGGSSVFSYLFPIIYLCCGLFNFKFNKIYSERISSIQIKRYLLVILLCIIGVCINVHGFKMLLYPFTNMLDSTMLLNISEWRNSSLSEIGHYPYFILLLFVLFIFIFSKKKIKLLDFILFLICVFLGLKSIRFWFYTYIIMSFYIFDYIEKRNNDKNTDLCLVFLSCLLFIMFISHSSTIFNSKSYYLLNNKDISFIKKLEMNRPFNMYDYGGDLIYNDVDVFIDGRADLYSKYNYKDYLSISKLEGDYIKLIDKYDFDYFIVDSNYPINTYLKYSELYSNIYNNKDLIIYKKNYSGE